LGLKTTDIDAPDEILELVSELVKDGEQAQKHYHLIAERNENWAEGRQFVDIAQRSQTLADLDWHPDLPKICQNHLRNLVNTYSARLMEDRPDATAWPTSNDPAAVASAEIGRKFIDYHGREIQLDQLMDDVGRIGTIHAIAGFKICFNPAADRVEWEPVSIYDFLLDPAATSYMDAKWVVFRTHVDPYQAQAELSGAGIDEEPPVEAYRVNGSEEVDGTEVLEIWHKPTARLPQGLFAKIIGRHVLDARPYPYVFRNLENPQGKPDAVLPLVYFKIDSKRGTPYADTWLSDVIGEQRLVNENEAFLYRIKKETAMVKMAVEDKSVVEQLTSGSQLIISPSGLGANGYMAPPQINTLLFADRDYHFKRMYDLAGLNEQLVGVDSVKSGTSAKQLAYMNKLDGEKHARTKKSIEQMLINAWKLTLQLVQHYYLDERIMRIAADEGFATQAFKGADIQGISVNLQPRPGLARMAASTIAEAESDVAAGIRNPNEMAGIRETGFTEQAAVANTKRIVQLEIAGILRGAQPQVDPHLLAPVAAQEAQDIAALLASQGVAPELIQAVQAYAEAYRQLAQQKQQAQQAQQQPGPQPGQRQKAATKPEPVGAERKDQVAAQMKAEGAQI
jgi:hypothetical protein